MVGKFGAITMSAEVQVFARRFCSADLVDGGPAYPSKTTVAP